MRHTKTLCTAAALLVVAALTGCQSAAGTSAGGDAGDRAMAAAKPDTAACCGACGLGPNAATAAASTEPLDDAAHRALIEALADERRAQALYSAVMARHGQVRPFVNIIRAEQRHEATIVTLLQRYGREVPANTVDVSDVPVPATIGQACALAAQLERDNVAMYDRLLGEITQQDVRTLMQALRRASQEHHLSAFERCTRRG